MERNALVTHLIRPRESDALACRKLSATRYVAEQVWRGLKAYEQEFLRAYAIGVGAQKSVVVGRSAAVIMGLWTLPAKHSPVMLANPRHSPPPKKQWPEGVQYREMRIPEVDLGSLSLLDGDTVLLTTPARTAVDVARLHGVRHGVVAMDSFLHQFRPGARVELEEVVRRLARKKGIAHARTALAWSSSLSQSPYESLLRVILRERGIEAQEQLWIGPYVRPDLLWDQLVIEVDGDVKFAEDGQTAALEQAQRENWIRVQGYEVARLTPRQILRDEDWCIRHILDLKARSEQLGPPRVPATQWRPGHGEHWRR